MARLHVSVLALMRNTSNQYLVHLPFPFLCPWHPLPDNLSAADGFHGEVLKKKKSKAVMVTDSQLSNTTIIIIILFNHYILTVKHTQ